MLEQPITIRRLGPEQVELLERPLPGEFDFAFDAARAWAFLSVRTNVMVAALEGRKLIGFGVGAVQMHPARETALYVSDIEVHAERRRRGIGRRIMLGLLDAAAERGCACLWLKIDGDNAAAKALCLGMEAETGRDSRVYVWTI